jgi:hypothetical protein
MNYYTDMPKYERSYFSPIYNTFKIAELVGIDRLSPQLQPLFKIDHTILNWPVNYDFSEVGIFFRNLISDNESFMFWHSFAEITTQNFNPLRRNRN